MEREKPNVSIEFLYLFSIILCREVSVNRRHANMLGSTVSIFLLPFVDIDECSSVTICSTGLTCVNTQGSYTCEASTGSVSCDSNPCDSVTSTCVDLKPGFRCDCKGPGYISDVSGNCVGECG